MKRKTAYNSTYPKVAVQWLNQALCFYQSLCLVDSEVLRNRHLRVAAKRYKPYSPMDKKDLMKLFDNVLKPRGFKKKGNYWRLDGDELIKIINLQKSQWGNQYYINYGFDFKDLDYDGTAMHIYRRIGSNDKDGNNILDFEKDLPVNRIKMVEGLLSDILTIFSTANTVTDIINDLKQREHLNDVTLNVKEFLGIQT